MNLPEDIKYTSDHEWARVDGDLVIIGITDFAQGELGDIVYLEVETKGDHVAAGEVFGSVEAVKTVSDLFMPIDGTIMEVNEDLDTNPELVNEDPYEKGWMVKIKPDNMDDLEKLLSAAAYKESLGVK